MDIEVEETTPREPETEENPPNVQVLSEEDMAAMAASAFQRLIDQEENFLTAEAKVVSNPDFFQFMAAEAANMAGNFVLARAVRFAKTGMPSNIKIRIEVDIEGVTDRTESGIYFPPTTNPGGLITP